MRTYILTQSTKGFMIRDDHMMGGVANELYAFSTLKEVQEYLPVLFKDKEPTDAITKE